MEILNEIWVWIVSALGGVSLAGVISAAIYGCLKGAFSKTISKINVEKIAKDATEKGIDKVKAVGMSKSQMYKQAGNSIVVDVLYYILKNMKLDLLIK